MQVINTATISDYYPKVVGLNLLLTNRTSECSIKEPFYRIEHYAILCNQGIEIDGINPPSPIMSEVAKYASVVR